MKRLWYNMKNRYRQLTKVNISISIILLLLTINTIPFIENGNIGVAYPITDLDYYIKIFDGNVLYVGGLGPGNYSNIQDAVDNASDGDIVFIYDDSAPYVELIDINVSIHLIGEDKHTTIIDGDYDGTVITVRSDDVDISNLFIRYGGFVHSGIQISANNITISNCIFEMHPHDSIVLSHASYNTISNCTFLFNMQGIHFFNSQFNTITDCDFTGNLYPIWFEDSHYNEILHCTINESWWSIDLDRSNKNTIYNNVITTNYDGIWMRDSQYNSILKNTFQNVGINIQGDDQISYLRIEGEYGQIILANCSDSEITNTILSGADYGIIGAFCTNITISNTEISILQSDLYSPDSCIRFIQSDNNKILTCQFTTNRCQGIILSRSSNNLFSECLIINCGSGLYLEQSNDNVISSCILENNGVGIGIRRSSGNMITDSTIVENSNGISLYYANENIISQNTIENSSHGIWQKYCHNSVIIDNTFIQNGLELWGEELSDFIHTIEGNTIDGQPLIYIKNQQEPTIVNQGKQIICVNSSNIDIQNVHLSGIEIGLELAYCTDIYLSNSQIDYNDYGAWFYNTTNTQIVNCTITDNNNDGLWLKNSHNNQMRSSTYSFNRRGLLLIDSNQTTIQDCNLTTNEGGVKILRSDITYIDNCRFYSNDFYGISIEHSENATITDCTLENGSSGIEIVWSSDIKILRCNLIDNIGNGISFIQSSVGEIRSCTITNSYIGIFLPFSDNILISNCNFINNTCSCFVSTGTSNTTITNCHSICNISGDIDTWGIAVESAHNNIIECCYISNNTWGVLLFGSDGTIIKNNELTLHSSGIEFVDENNRGESSLPVPFVNQNKSFLDEIEQFKCKTSSCISSNNEIIENNISYNNYGIFIDSSSGNLIYHNNIINNTISAYDEGANSWDAGEDDGGNFWSDYTGFDEDGDGIGDEPYDISGGDNQDRYPLISPFTNPEITELGLEITGGIGLSLAIKNNGDFDAIDVEWNVSITGGLFGLINIQLEGNISIIPVGVKEIITIPVFGLGKIIMHANAFAFNANNYSITENGRVILIFVKVL